MDMKWLLCLAGVINVMPNKADNTTDISLSVNRKRSAKEVICTKCMRGLHQAALLLQMPYDWGRKRKKKEREIGNFI